MYAITGASGNTGQIISEILLNNGRQVRVVGRSKERLQNLIDKGAEPYISDMTNPDFLTEAFLGSSAVYAMIPPNLGAVDFRSYQNEVGESIAKAIQNADVKNVVFLSSLGAERPDKNGPVGGLYDMEQRLNKIEGLNLVHLRPTFFMENLLDNMGMIKNQGINGGSLKPDLAFPMIATKDIAHAAADHLLKLNFQGKTVRNLFGQRDLTMDEVTRILGEAIGQPDLKYIQFSYEDTENAMVQMGIPQNIVKLFTELNKSVNEGIIISDIERNEENTTSTSIEEFSKIFATVYNS